MECLHWPFPADIVRAPASQVVSAEERTASFFCTVDGLDVEWLVNGHSITDRQDDITIMKSPLMDGQRIGTIAFPTDTRFNATRVRCVAKTSSHTLSSSEAVMLIAGIYYIYIYIYM